MRIVEERPTRLVLRGVPHGAGWMLFSLLFGLGAGAACVGIMAASWPRRLNWAALQMIPLSIGILMGGFFALFGLWQLLSREELEMDRVLARGVYRVRSLVLGERKRLEFRLDQVKHVSLEAYTSSGPQRGSMPRPALRCRLLLAMPKRRAIELDDTQNGREARVEGVARAVAGFLGTEPVKMGKGSRRRRRAKRTR